MKNLKTNQKGFTIIEVMIVLVIAAVILLIVFLAVPALQRNSRNTQRKSESARLSSAAREYRIANGGAWPTDGELDTFKDELIGGAGDFSFYTAETINILTSAQVEGTITYSSDLTALAAQYTDPLSSEVNVLPGARCENGSQILRSPSDVAVIYGRESSNSMAALCL